MSDLDTLIAANYELIWKYRFIYREQAALLRNDKDLHERYLMIRQHGYEGFAALIEAFVAAGVLSQPANSQGLKILAELC